MKNNTGTKECQGCRGVCEDGGRDIPTPRSPPHWTSALLVPIRHVEETPLKRQSLVPRSSLLSLTAPWARPLACSTTALSSSDQMHSLHHSPHTFAKETGGPGCISFAGGVFTHCLTRGLNGATPGVSGALSPFHSSLNN